MLIPVTSNWIGPVTVSKSSNFLVSFCSPSCPWTCDSPPSPAPRYWDYSCFWLHLWPKDECCYSCHTSQAVCMLMPHEDGSLPRVPCVNDSSLGFHPVLGIIDTAGCSSPQFLGCSHFPPVKQGNMYHHWQEQEPTEVCFLLNGLKYCTLFIAKSESCP